MAAKTTDPIDILLEMGIDLDNLSEEEDYLSALMEAANTLTIKDASDPRIAPLQQEILKLRKKRFNKARPEAKKTIIKPDAFFDRKTDEVKQDVKTGAVDLSKLKFSSVKFAEKQKALPTSAITPYQAPEEEEGAKKKRAPRKSDPLKDILKGVNSIIEILKRQQKLSAKQAEKDRKRAEKQKRAGAEDKLESGGVKSFISGAAKLVKPVKGFLEGLFDFIKNVIIGTVLIKIINWFTDPENQEKIEAIGDFFKNTWPVLLAAYLLFGNSLGRFAVKLIKVVGGFVIKLAAKIIPALITGIKRLGLGKSLALGGLAVGGAMLAGRMMDGGEDDKDLNQPDGKQKTPPPDKESEPAVIPAPAVADPPEPQTVSGRFDMEAGQGYINNKPVSLEEYQDFQNMSSQEKVQKYGTGMKGGGMVPGRGPNRDTVPAMLAPGEFVMSRGAVQKYGASTMASMNAAGGGTNLPKRMNGVTYAVGGGLMGGMSDYGYGDDKKEEPSPTVAKEMEKRKEKSSNPVGDFFGGMATGVRSLFGGGSDNEESVEEKNEDGGDTKGGISKNAKALLNTIRWAEGTLKPDGYNTWFGGRSDMDLTSMTINEVVAEQKKRLSSGEATYGKYTSAAVGAYQMMKPEAFAAAAGLTGDSKFTPENQDKMAIAGYMMGQAGMSAEEIDAPISRAQIAKMAPVWASLPMMNGQSRYGQPVKRYEDLVAVYEQNQKGLDPSSFTATTGIKGAPNSSPGPGGGGVSPSGTTMASLSDYKFGSGIATLTGGKTGVAGRSPSGTTMASLQGKKSFQSPPGPPPTSPPSIGGSMPGGSQQGSSANSASKMKSNANNFPEIDANAMISMEKVKVLGLTLA